MNQTKIIKTDNQKIAVLSDAAYPFSGADTFQVIKNVNALHDSGVDVSLIIPVRFGRVFKSRRKRLNELSEFYNIQNMFDIRYLYSFPSSKLRIERFFHNIVAPFYAAVKGYDIVYTRQPLAMFISFLLGKKVIFETYRLLGSEFPRAFSALVKFFNHPRFIGCITHSNISREDIVKAGVPDDKAVVMYNGFDTEEVLPAYTREEARKKLNIPSDSRVIVYAGNMQLTKGVETIVDIAGECRDYSFYLVGGEDAHIKRLREYAAQSNITNVVFPGFKNNKEVAQYLYASDVLIIPPTAKALSHGRTVLPIKVFIYLASGRPILAPRQADIMELLVDGENSILVEPDNLKESAGALTRLIEDRDLNRRIGEEAGRLGMKFTWENRGKRIREWIYSKI